MTAASKLFAAAAVVTAAAYRRHSRTLTVKLARAEYTVGVFEEIARRQILADVAEWESEIGGAA